MDGVTLGTSSNTITNRDTVPYVNWFFKRAVGVFDVVHYTGSGGSATSQPHILGVVPEFVIIKSRISTQEWIVYFGAPTQALYLGYTQGAAITAGAWNNTAHTSTHMSLGVSSAVNGTGPYAAYLFASKAGISKVGSYTGNGSSQTINCGFSTGARFVLIKRTDASGDWYVWDTTRGIVAGNDPHLSLNTTAAEVTTNDSIDPDVSGFIVNQVAATNINVSGGSFIYLAFA
jgi:hypothetical protein